MLADAHSGISGVPEEVIFTEQLRYCAENADTERKTDKKGSSVWIIKIQVWILKPDTLPWN